VPKVASGSSLDGRAAAAPASGIARRRSAAKDESNPAYLERRREIVAAAARVFKAKGLQGSKLGDIAAESGADRASLYYYVGSKEELFHEVVREAVEANLVRAEAIRDGHGMAPEKLRALIRSLMASYCEHYPILYVYIQENLTHVPEEHRRWAEDMRQVNRSYERVVIGLLEQGVREGTLRDVGPPWVVAYGLMGMLGWTNRWFDPEESSASPEQIADAFADTVLLGLVEPHGDARARPPA
jgi:AcrR family transcriptional regulator